MSHRAVFLDRDGTVIEHYDYLTEVSQVRLLEGVGPAMRLLQKRGFKLVMITNQSGVARGKLTEEKLNQIHDHLKRLLADKGAYLDGIYYCPFHPEATVEQYRQDSDLRKPSPGMLTLAAKDLDLDLTQSWVVGDDDRDILSGQAANCRTILLEERGSTLVRRGETQPDFRAKTLQEAANLIVRHADQKMKHDTAESDIPSQTSDHHPTPTDNNVIDHTFDDTDVSKSLTATALRTVAAAESISPSADARPNGTIRQQEIERRKTKISTIKKREHPAEPDMEENPKLSDKPVTPEVLLQQILKELKSFNRHQSMGADFSISKLFAGVVQMLVLMFLLMAFRFGSGSEPRLDIVQICLSLAMVFQILTLTLVLWSKKN